MFGNRNVEKREDDDTFARRIRNVIEDHTGKTSGIKVFEHDDETALDEQEREILAKLREAHEKWHANNPTSSGNTDEDAFKSVKIRI